MPLLRTADWRHARIFWAQHLWLEVPRNEFFTIHNIADRTNLSFSFFIRMLSASMIIKYLRNKFKGRRISRSTTLQFGLITYEDFINLLLFCKWLSVNAYLIQIRKSLVSLLIRSILTLQFINACIITQWLLIA